MKKNLKKILIIMAILIIIAVILVIVINMLQSNTNKSDDENVINETRNVISDEEIEKDRDEAIASKPETSRIKTYIGQFFSYIDNQDYQDAYDTLFDNFKNNYFTSLEQFEQYVVNKYPKNIVLNYEDIDREGYIFIVTVQVMDGLNLSNSFTQRIVIQENGVNDYNISFQMD